MRNRLGGKQPRAERRIIEGKSVVVGVVVPRANHVNGWCALYGENSLGWFKSRKTAQAALRKAITADEIRKAAAR